MEDFNSDFTSLTSVKRSPVTNRSSNGGNNENELNPEMASKLNNQSPSKNFMSSTISASNKTSFPKKKILAERNQTPPNVTEPKTSHLRSSSLDSKASNFPVFESENNDLQPYDPIKNYLSPRPKFLRYNPNRRREIFVFKENEDGVRSCNSSTDSGITSFGLEKENSSGSRGSCSPKESLKEAMDMAEQKEGEKEEDDTGSCFQKESLEEAAMDMAEQESGSEDDDDDDEIEEELVEFEENKGCGFIKGFLKFLFVVISLILTTQSICSMNSPTPSSHTFRVNDWYGKRWSDVNGVVGLNFSEVVDSIRESGLLVGSLKEGEIYRDFEELDAVESNEDSEAQLGVLDDEVENGEIDVIQDEILSQKEGIDQLQLIEILQENEIAESEVMEIHNLETDQDLEQDLGQVFDQDLEQDLNQELGQDLNQVLDQDLEQDLNQELDQDLNKELDQDLNQDGVIEEEQFDANEKKSQMTIDDIETAKDMEDGLEEIDELETTTTDVSIGMAGFDLIIPILIGFSILILTSFGVIYHSKSMKKMKPTSPPKENLVAEKQDIKNLEPSPSSIQPIAEKSSATKPSADPASLVVDPMPQDVTKEVSHQVHAPTVELLGEFEFGGEVTNSSFRSNDMKSYTISVDTRPATVSSGQTRSSRMEGDSNTAEKTVKKPRRKTVEVSPSPVRRSNRIQSRSAAIKSP